jgi:hypothetical protein
MSLLLPLAVWTETSHGYFDLSGQVYDLQFRSEAPGGFASATFTLARPLDVPGDEIEYYAPVYVFDTRTGETAWEGRQEDPGRSAGDTAGAYRMTAMGPSARTHDRIEPVVYCDRGPANWVLGAGTAKYIRVDLGGQTEAGGLVNMKAEVGATWAIGDAAGITYTKVAECGQTLARVRADWDTGLTNANSEVQLLTSVDGAAGTVRNSATWNTAGGLLVASRGAGSDIPIGQNWAFLRVIRPAVAGTGGDTVWAEFILPVVRGILKDVSGNDITGNVYSSSSVLAHEVVKDVLGRLLSAVFDGPNAVIATTSYAINHLVYLDGADAQKIFDDLALLEPGYYWAAWESGWGFAKTRFEYVAWPTSTVRYEVDLTDIDAPAAAADLFDGVRVRYRDTNGTVQLPKFTQTVAELVRAGFSRTGFLDLGDEPGSTANAVQAAAGFLAEHKFPPNAGRLSVDRPVADLELGRYIDPWEIRPGHLITVRGILPRVDALNATTRDPVTTYRIRSVDFSASSATAQLELDSYSRTTMRAIADLQRQAVTRRR